MAERVRVRRPSPVEGQRLQQIVRCGESKTGGNAVRWRRAVMFMASAAGNTVPVIGPLVATDENTPAWTDVRLR
jgi:hypothetical protein